VRLAIVSDLHANLHAVEAVSKDIEDALVDEVWCLGDVVGYGADPRGVLEWTDKHARILIKGNHDQAVATGDVEGFNPVAAAAARYHTHVLSPPERARLHDLPLDASRDLGTEEAALLVHGSPDDPLREYVFPASVARGLTRWQGLAGLILLGHTHVPFAGRVQPSNGHREDGAWSFDGFEQVIDAEGDKESPPLVLVNPGSVGQPRDGDPRAAYALVDTRARRIQLRRVGYDIDAAARAINAARLDPFLAQRLYRGI
jgi:predicted phosphodiesterase